MGAIRELTEMGLSAEVVDDYLHVYPATRITNDCRTWINANKARLIGELSANDAGTTWHQAHNSFINHIMACPACYAPRDRYCSEGADLRRVYLDTYQSTASNPEPFPTIKRP